jgi:two-component system sensor histidine kinase KdpD
MAWRRILRMRGAGLLAGAAGVAVVTAGIEAASGEIEVLSMAVCYQLVVLVVSGAFGAAAGLWTSLASALAFNWFFIPPTQTLTIGDSRNWISLTVFAVTAVVTSRLAAGFRSQRRESDARRRDAELLAGLARTVLAEIGPGGPGTRVADAAARALGVRWCAIVLGSDGPGRAPVATLIPSAQGFSVPLEAGGRTIGLLEVGPALEGEDPRWARPGFAVAVAGMTALAAERGRLIERALETEGLRRSDELKTALLRGVSHEFRTPLTSIRTAAHAVAEDPAGPNAADLLATMTAWWPTCSTSRGSRRGRSPRASTGAPLRRWPRRPSRRPSRCSRGATCSWTRPRGSRSCAPTPCSASGSW